ncbi:hypothetical protein T05_2823 [Trichinella murrelli]|uniref:DDE-1 domain-containing protein n=1 Tax=Trichinella murrelli TaxID=144512 RepID=A0A0V0T9G1_9BILA|nr:hypothetical protein T05_2823 [Trichinella murrelli]
MEEVEHLLAMFNAEAVVSVYSSSCVDNINNTPNLHDELLRLLYTRRSVARLVAAMDENIHLEIMDYWKEFSIADCLCLIMVSVRELKVETVHGGGFKDLQKLEVTELIESYMSELTDEELVEMTASIDEIKDADDDSATDETEKLTLEELVEIL